MAAWCVSCWLLFDCLLWQVPPSTSFGRMTTLLFTIAGEVMKILFQDKTKDDDRQWCPRGWEWSWRTTVPYYVFWWLVHAACSKAWDYSKFSNVKAYDLSNRKIIFTNEFSTTNFCNKQAIAVTKCINVLITFSANLFSTLQVGHLGIPWQGVVTIIKFWVRVWNHGSLDE